MHFITSQTSRLDDNHEILNIDASKISIAVLVFAVTSFFIHLMLHNYNSFKDNAYGIQNYSSISENTIINPENTNSLGDIEATNSDLHQIYPKYQLSQLQNHEQKLKPDVKLTTIERKLNVKKLGNVTVVSMTSGNTLTEALSAAGIVHSKSSLIATAINKKYKLTKIQSGDTVQIIKLSNDSSKNDNIKIIIAQKTEILVKGNTAQYDVLVRSLERNLKKKVDIFAGQKNESIRVNPSIIQRAKFDSKNITNANLTLDIKRDLLQILYMIKQENQFKNGSLNINVLYEKISSKNSNLFYIELQNHNAKVRVYKYKDNTGVVQYIKNDGKILTKNQQTQVVPKNLFRLSYPIEHPVISSAFGMRSHPLTGRYKMHKGIDFRARRGTAIYAPADGVIVEMTSGRGYGKYVRLAHNSTYTTLYAHLDRFNNKTVGHKISKGEIIGYTGSSGRTSGAHLHFELYENGKIINPARLISNIPGLKTVNLIRQLNSKQMTSFNAHKSSIDKKIASL